MNVKNFICILACLISLHVISNAQSKNFFDYNEGLSNSLINKLYQDNKGFIWVATEDGLNRFDGIQFKSFFADKERENSLKNNFVTTIVEDQQEKLWVGQISGLQVYNPETESFSEIELITPDERIHLFISSIIVAESQDIWLTTSGYGLIRIDHITGEPDYNSELNKRLCSQYLRVIYEDKEGVMWIGSDNNGLNAYYPKTGELKLFSESNEKNSQLPSNNISSICQDNNGYIYVGSLKGGLVRIDKIYGKVEEVKSFNEDEENLPVKSLLFDSKNRLWIGTDGFGIRILNPDLNKMESYSPNISPFDFSNSKIHSLIEDKGGNVWAGIFQKGLYLFAEAPEIFQNYGYRAFGEGSIGSSCVTSILGIDEQIWVGTDGDGVYRINQKDDRVSHLLLENEDGENYGNNILTIHHGHNDYVWFGTYFNGLIRYNKLTGRLKNFKYDPGNINSLVNDNITCIQEDQDGVLWIGTLGGGICRFNPESEVFYSGLCDSDSINSLIPQWINALFIDRNHNLWIGTYVGLYNYDVKARLLKLYSQAEGAIPNNTVFTIKNDQHGNIWVGTYGGLTRIDPITSETKIFSVEDGLCNNVICAMNQDEYGNIWISTHNGLSRFDPDNENFTNYYASDGLQANEFYRNATYKSENNILYFGGINGITGVKRNYQELSRNIRDVLLTDFTRFNQPVEIGDKSGKHIILNKSIVLADTVVLHERDNVVSIGFTSGELASQSRISYEYMMEGFDEKWITTNASNRRATYTNLEYGTYKFIVRAVDKGQYSKPRALTIIINPSWYKTPWAKTLWSILIAVFLLGIIRFYKEFITRRHLEKMDEMKMQFFINISHEIKTPLTLIIDPIEKLRRKKSDAEASRLYNIVYQNACRISRLVNQLMDVSRIDKGMILVKFQKTNLYEFIMDIAKSFALLASDKKIIFNIFSQDKEIEVWIDPLNFEKVIYNLLSNAFKFTQGGGKVDLTISQVQTRNNEGILEDRIEIVVEDNGTGIKESEIERIFNRFYQFDFEDPHHRGGTGVGLHLSRALVNLHKGELRAENRTDCQGSRFIIQLRPGNEHLPKEDLILDENIIPAPTHRIHKHFLPEISKIMSWNSANTRKDLKLLVVEDEQEIREYLCAELSENYQIISAGNGKQAYSMVMEEKPNLVISDIMMPEMDGITLCKKIKGNLETSHIPVILLTALSKDENRAEGIDTGADMYIVKPFNCILIKKIIKNILENRKKLYTQIKAESGQFDVDHPKIKSRDEIIMQKVMTIIKENIDNENLNVEMLADGVGISRVHMHRKLKQLTNQSARELIRNIRMKQASYLLTTKELSVSEVAFTLGFSNLSHFSNSFKNYYGTSPKEFIYMQDKEIKD